jgi:hypothetical protein
MGALPVTKGDRRPLPKLVFHVVRERERGSRHVYVWRKERTARCGASTTANSSGLLDLVGDEAPTPGGGGSIPACRHGQDARGSALAPTPTLVNGDKSAAGCHV